MSRGGSLSEPPEVESPQPPSTPRQDGTADLLKTLIPALIRDPAMYEESISSICTLHNIDPSVVSAIKFAVDQGSSSRPLARYVSLPFESRSKALMNGPKSPDVGSPSRVVA